MARWGAILAVLLLLVLVGCGEDGETAPPAWNHDPEDASLGPAAWGDIDDSFEQCAAGDEQSPVDITTTVAAQLPVLEFSYPGTTLAVENTGHVIEASLPEGNGHTLTIGDDEYRLVQFHFHAPSEHTVDGRSYDAELHLVHQSEADEFAVVSVLFDESVGPVPLVDDLVQSAPEETGEEVNFGPASPLLMLGVADSVTAVDDTYHTYFGSLTTPGCNEGVRWIVDREPLGISIGTTERLHELIAGFPGYDGYENNNRPTQPLNDRQIESSS